MAKASGLGPEDRGFESPRPEKIFLAIYRLNKGYYQPDWYPNFPDDFRDDYFKMFEATKVDIIEKQTNKYQKTIWKQRPGADNHAFDTYGYNMAALEIFADAYCRDALGLPGLSRT